MQWVRDVMWGFNAITAYATVIPIMLGGAAMAAITARVRTTGLRVLGISSVIVLQALASTVFYRSIAALGLILLPVTTEYPYLSTPSLLFFWIPVVAQVLYIARAESPRPLRAALTGLAAVAAGFVFLLVGAPLVGAEMD